MNNTMTETRGREALDDVELSNVVGGNPLVFGALLAVAAYVGKDIYDNWPTFKEGFSDGYQAVLDLISTSTPPTNEITSV